MHAQSAQLVPPHAWYLSSVAVDPASQGHGLGRQLLAPTLAEADRTSTTCFLETFTPGSEAFYLRLRLVSVVRLLAPASSSSYRLMLCKPL